MFKGLLAIVAIAFAVAACDQSPQAASPAPPPMKYGMVFTTSDSFAISPKSAETIVNAATSAKCCRRARGRDRLYRRVRQPKVALSLRPANTVKDAR